MSHLSIDITRYEVNAEIILAGISQVVNERDRIAIVGPNGVGKTTFLKILTGEIEATIGGVENKDKLTLGYLSQIHFDHEERSVREELRTAFDAITRLQQEIRLAEDHMTETGESEKYLELLEKYENLGGERYLREIDRVARGLEIFHLLDRSIREISGGERTKVALAKVLLLKPDILILDEPTNHIDLESVEWLEIYLQDTWKGGYVIVSHDREFLDSTCSQVWEMRGKAGIVSYTGGYRTYILEREETEKRLIKNYEEQKAYLQEQAELVNRFRAGSRSGWAASREKALEKIEKLEMPYAPFRPNFRFEYSRKPTESILKIRDVFVGRSEPLFFIREIELRAGERVGIVGPNGAGKSTFLKTVLGEIAPLEWNLAFGGANDVMVYSQTHEELRGELSVYDQADKLGLTGTRERIASVLAPYGFAWGDLDRKVGELSGGQRSRLLFAILGLRPSNVLILDEPTNHLDTDSREALEKALHAYKGTILFISHDRYFVNSLASKLWVVDRGEMVVCYGNYADFLIKKERGIDFDISLWNPDGEMSLVLEEKLGKAEARRIKAKFGRGKK